MNQIVIVTLALTGMLIALIPLTLIGTAIFAFIGDNSQKGKARSVGYHLNIFNPISYKQRWFNVKLPTLREAYLKGLSDRAAADLMEKTTNSLQKILEAKDIEAAEVYKDTQENIIENQKEILQKREEYFALQSMGKPASSDMRDTNSETELYDWKPEIPEKLGLPKI